MFKILTILFSLFATLAQAQSTQRLCYTTNGSNCAPSIQASKTIPINIASATTTELVALVANQTVYVTSWDVMAGGTGNFTLEYGTGTTCGTGTTILTGAYPLIAQAGISKGNGLGPVLIVPSGNALCAVTSTGVQFSGSISYAQFKN
jgi:hypothetical protein